MGGTEEGEQRDWRETAVFLAAGARKRLGGRDVSATSSSPRKDPRDSYFCGFACLGTIGPRTDLTASFIRPEVDRCVSGGWRFWVEP